MGIYYNNMVFYGFRAKITPKLLRLFSNNPLIEIMTINIDSALVMIKKSYRSVGESIDYSRKNDKYFTKEEMSQKVKLDIDVLFNIDNNSKNIFRKENINAYWCIAQIMNSTLDLPYCPSSLEKIVPIMD